MKKNTLLQLIIIFFGISAIYVATYFVVENLYRLIAVSTVKYNDFFVEFLLSYAVVGLFGFVVIAKSGSIATAVANRAGMDDSITIYTRPKQLLSMLIVITALSHLLDRVPTFMQNLFGIFTNARYYGNDNRESGWVMSFVELIPPCLVIVFSKNLTNYFAKNIMYDEDETVVEHETIDIGEDNVLEEEPKG